MVKRESFFWRHYYKFAMVFIIVAAVLMLLLIVANRAEVEQFQIDQINICTTDCESLDKEYFRYDGEPGTSADKDCFCKKDNEVQQIW